VLVFAFDGHILLPKVIVGGLQLFQSLLIEGLQICNFEFHRISFFNGFVELILNLIEIGLSIGLGLLKLGGGFGHVFLMVSLGLS
jgi:hypothetical protein